MGDLEDRYIELMATPDHAAEARIYKPLHERQVFGRSVMLFDNVPRERLAPLGELRTPSIADLFVAIIGGQSPQTRGIAA
jgi:ABC-2 type transport system ATP-binding protein